MRDLSSGTSEQVSAADRDSPSLELHSLLAVFRRQKRTIIGFALGVLALAVLVLLQIDRAYTATTLVLVDSRESELLGGPALPQDVSALEQGIDTEVELARSPPTLIRAVQDMDFWSFPSLNIKASLLQNLMSLLGFDVHKPPSPATAWGDLSEPDQAEILRRFGEVLDVSRRGLTRVIAIAATGKSPAEAAALSNKAALAYLENQRQAKLDANQRVAAVIKGQVDNLLRGIADVENQTNALIEQAQVGSPEEQARIATIRRDIESRGQNRSEISARLRQLNDAVATNDAAALGSILDQQNASSFSKAQNNLTAQLGGARRSTSAADLNANGSRLQGARNLAEQQQSNLQEQIRSLDGETDALRAELRTVLSGIQLPTDLALKFYQLQRDSQAQRSLYEASLARLRGVEQEASVLAADSRIIAPARAPTDPSYPPIKLILTVATLAAVGLGCGMGFLREYYIGGFTRPNHLEDVTGVRLLSVIPKDTHSRLPGGPADAVIDAPLSAFSEAIRRIILGVESSSRAASTVIVLTSTVPAEGKSTIALALARATALSGRSTILIDGDLRHPSIHHLVSETPTETLGKFLSRPVRSIQDDDPIFTTEGETGLRLVLSSEGAKVATDVLIGSEQFASLVAYSRSKAKMVIIDTPPVGLVVDARLAAKYADVCVLVVAWADTSQQGVVGAIREIQDSARAEIFTVLNKAESGALFGNSQYASTYYQS